MALILERLSDRRKKEKKVPRVLSYLLNDLHDDESMHNFYTDIYASHNKEENKILDSWSLPKDGDDILFCGCTSRLFPGNIENSKVLAPLPKIGNRYDCCGIYTIKSGLFNRAQQNAENIIQSLSKSNFKRLVMVCGSCQETFTHSYWKYMGIKFPFEVISIYEYLDEKIKNGELHVQRKIDYEAVISDSCFANELGEKYQEAIRSLCNTIGITITELNHNKEKSTCCGMTAIVQNGSLFDVIKAGRMNHDEIKHSGKRNVVTYCQGCFLAQDTKLITRNTHYLLDTILYALGDNPAPMRIIKKMFNRTTIFHLIKIAFPHKDSIKKSPY